MFYQKENLIESFNTREDVRELKLLRNKMTKTEKSIKFYIMINNINLKIDKDVFINASPHTAESIIDYLFRVVVKLALYFYSTFKI